MPLPPDFKETLRHKTDEQLYDMLVHKADYLPETLDATRTELNRRNLPVEEQTEPAVPVETTEAKPQTTKFQTTLTFIGILCAILFVSAVCRGIVRDLMKGWLQSRNTAEQAPQRYEDQDWQGRTCSGLTLQAPFPLLSRGDKSADFSPGLRATIERADGFEANTRSIKVTVDCTVYKESAKLDPNVDRALDRSINAVLNVAAKQAGINNPDWKVDRIEVSGLNARRANWVVKRTPQYIYCAVVVIQKGKRSWMVVAFSESEDAAVIVNRMLDSIQISH
ncbi:MAG: hypothetical protein NT105_16310 [Verrucomicrobia bacterium]|nr:hypothetical protein [Verrucomicrobiota bacterium]